MEIAGYLGALIIGVVLGLIGGGGSILTVPVFVYLLGIEPMLATAYSLFVVGSTALVGAVRNSTKGLIDYKVAVLFSIPAFIAVYVARKFIMPALPETLFTIAEFEVSKSFGIMVFFAIIMLLAAVSMIKNKKEELEKPKEIKGKALWVILEGAGVGLLTGIVGAGGGFLIIPALVLLAGLPMKKAVATSLLIIAVKSLIGFIGDVENLEIEWMFLLKFSAFSIIGIFLGIYLNKWIEGKKLKKAFGYFVLAMAIFIIYKEIA
jgi:uncharacterized membrane protein YfcA